MSVSLETRCLHTPNFKCLGVDFGWIEGYCLPQIHKLRLVYSISDRDSNGIFLNARITWLSVSLSGAMQSLYISYAASLIKMVEKSLLKKEQYTPIIVL